LNIEPISILKKFYGVVAHLATITAGCGAPPKIIWIRRGYCSTHEIEAIPRRHAEEINSCLMSPDCAGMMLY
jgi:predicted nuclease of predicted toxin-antitoxin system